VKMIENDLLISDRLKAEMRELDYRFTGQSYVKLFCVIVSHVVAVS